MATLYLLRYNNYYNRLVKKEETLGDYQDYMLGDALQGINFIPNDGITTTQIINWNNEVPDYLVVADEFNNIISRWFVIESVRTRSGQFQLSLHRDTVADYYNIIMQAPCFIEKGYVSNNNPLILNKENMGFNQIKMGEYLLDGGALKTPWIVAYLPRYDAEGNFNSWSGSFRDEPPSSTIKVSSLESYKYYKYSENPYIYLDGENVQFQINYWERSDYDELGTDAADRVWGITSTGYYNNTLNSSAISSTLPIYEGNGSTPTFESESIRENAYRSLLEAYNDYSSTDSVSGLPVNSLSNIGTYEGAQTLNNLANSVIQVGTGTSATYYKIVVNYSSETYQFDTEVKLQNTAGSFGQVVFNTLTQETNKWTYLSDSVSKTPTVRWPYQNPGISLSFQKIATTEALNYDFNYTHIVTKNSPYEIIAAPYYDVTLTHGIDTLAHNGEVALNWFIDMAKGGKVYDVQIVPYVGIDSGDISGYDIIQCYYSLTPTPAIQSWAVKLQYASFNKRYSISLPVDSDIKQGNECDLYRLTSPNGIGSFDFNPAKNGGLIGYEVDCTLIPYNPYIKVNPVFNLYTEDNQTNLYGGDFNDFRGLICGGDFSVPLVTSAWETYQVNNKYYQQVFDRGIASLEYNNNWQLTNSLISAATGTAQGAITGFAAGGVGGAITGGLSSLAGSAYDITRQQALFREGLDFRKDQFEYNLGNIKARPETLSRTTSFNINNKYFPYIEYYSCTETEKTIFRNKLKYNGMTVMAIGKLKNYLSPYDNETFVKGKLLRLEGIDDDSHVANAIAEEISRGVFVKKQ